MSKKKTTPATKSDNQQANSGPERGWIKPRTGLLVMALASVAFAVFVILTGLREGMSFAEVLPTAGIYMLMMWGVFGIMMLFFRFTRRQ